MAEHQIEGSIFKFLSQVFKKHNIQAVLVGGYALIANKVQRMTFDIDFLISQDACNKIEGDIINVGYSLLNRQDAFVQFKSEKVGLRDIDFLIGHKHTIDLLIAQGKSVLIAGEPFIVPSPEHLIAMKLHSIAGNKMRELKDFPDIVNLMMANAIDPRSETIKSMFDKYALLDFYDRVIATIRNERGK
jgi:hypothetical protein